MDLPDPSPVLTLIEAFRGSKVMFAAVSLGVFDHLAEAGTAQELASALQVQTEPLERLLDACVGLKLIHRNGLHYENLPVAQAYLCRKGPQSLTGYILYSNEVLFRLWSYLEDAVREGTPRWKQSLGSEGSIFDHFFRTPEAKHTFLQGMHGLGTLSSPAVAQAFDLSRFKQLVDLGGATGHLAIAACERFPDLRAVVFDLAEVIGAAQIHVSQSPARGRIRTAAGDFFRDELRERDRCARGRIVHDWPDEKVHALLRKIYRTLPHGGGLLLAEKMLHDDKSGPVSAQLQSLNMLVCTEGKERSLEEYRQLLEAAGFRDIQGSITQRPLDAIFALKPRDAGAK